MAYSVDWVNKVITIPVSDMTLVSGTEYDLDMADFHGEIRRLESAFDEGLWAPQILDHTNTKLNFAGANYAAFDEIINGYSIIFAAPATRVNLKGSNNNILDVLTATGVSVASFNSAGLQQVSTGSGLDATERNWVQRTYQANFNRRKHDSGANTVTLYDDDGLTPLQVWDAAVDLSELDPQ